jgi:hypothetical protein
MCAILVVRMPEPLDAGARTLLDDLRPHLVRQDWTTEWPGTRLLGDRAWVGRYELTHDCVAVLAGAASGMFQWQHPALPEDLSLLRADGTTWFASTANERAASFELSEVERRALLDDLPALRALLDPPGHGHPARLPQ